MVNIHSLMVVCVCVCICGFLSSDTKERLNLKLFPTPPTNEKSKSAEDLSFQVFCSYLNVKSKQIKLYKTVKKVCAGHLLKLRMDEP